MLSGIMMITDFTNVSMTRLVNRSQFVPPRKVRSRERKLRDGGPSSMCSSRFGQRQFGAVNVAAIKGSVCRTCFYIAKDKEDVFRGARKRMHRRQWQQFHHPCSSNVFCRFLLSHVVYSIVEINSCFLHAYFLTFG
ncbi:unnamed protein product [Nippostrongylus brasiliensis]|uniref:Secreted protein n=1 Tax=Nippostrongylus brasiliensis TaxID=27835 RepID=A0A158QWR7_NIPBR|nr:unnamed protein product [Nippostrongylus brasiliensis]